jgi:HD superfamily phosphohydrolase
VDDSRVGQIKTFVIGSKAILAAEAFVLGLFHLYPAVYFHKATRSAEKIFTELLVRIVSLVRDGNENATGLPDQHPLIRFAMNPDDLDTALNLDDTAIWGSLGLLAEAKDVLVAEYSWRLRDRKLLKAIDVRAQVIHYLDPESRSEAGLSERVDRCCASIHEKLTIWSKDKVGRESRLLIDEAERSPYKTSIDLSGFTKQINVLTDGGVPVDIKQRSSVVAALSTFKLLRVYVRPDDASAREFVERTIKGEIDKCP